MIDTAGLKSWAAGKGQTALWVAGLMCGVLTLVVQLLTMLVVGLIIICVSTNRAERLFRLLRLLLDRSEPPLHQ